MRRLLITTALLAIACAPDAQARKRWAPELPATCSLSAPFSGDSLPAQCTTLAVPENPAAPAGRKINLKIAWIPAERG